jgi:hypothetical protein
LDVNTVSRILDNLLLEGEVFAFKAGLAFIEYYYLELKMATFDDAICMLKNQSSSNSGFSEEYFFDIVEDIKIPFNDFH